MQKRSASTSLVSIGKRRISSTSRRAPASAESTSTEFAAITVLKLSAAQSVKEVLDILHETGRPWSAYKSVSISDGVKGAPLPDRYLWFILDESLKLQGLAIDAELRKSGSVRTPFRFIDCTSFVREESKPGVQQ